ncbi:glycosyltransferase [bacterium]|nr:MAG: glycosyltransferase [bacterium]
MKKTYDVIIICFADPNLDARTINLTKTLVKYGRNVALVTPNYGRSIDYLAESDFYKCKVNLNQRVFLSQKEFTKQVKKLNLTAKFVHSGDYYSLVAAKKIKIKEGAKLIYDSREIYSKLNSLTKRPLAQKYLEIKEKYLITYVDKVIVTAEEDEKYLKKHFMHTIPYSIIKNLPPKSELKKSNKLREKFNIANEKLILIYQGWILEGRGLDLLIDSMKQIDSSELVIIGDGNYLKNLKAKVKLLGLEDKVHFTGFIDYSKLHKYTMSADIGLVIFENSSISYQNALPNKLFEYIQSGIPVITSNQKTISEIVSEESIGIILDKLDIDQIVNAINKMQSVEVRNRFIENIIRIREKYSYESQEVEILKVYS